MAETDARKIMEYLKTKGKEFPKDELKEYIRTNFNDEELLTDDSLNDFFESLDDDEININNEQQGDEEIDAEEAENNEQTTAEAEDEATAAKKAKEEAEKDKKDKEDAEKQAKKDAKQNALKRPYGFKNFCRNVVINGQEKMPEGVQKLTEIDNKKYFWCEGTTSPMMEKGCYHRRCKAVTTKDEKKYTWEETVPYLFAKKEDVKTALEHIEGMMDFENKSYRICGRHEIRLPFEMIAFIQEQRQAVSEETGALIYVVNALITQLDPVTINNNAKVPKIPSGITDMLVKFMAKISALVEQMQVNQVESDINLNFKLQSMLANLQETIRVSGGKINKKSNDGDIKSANDNIERVVEKYTGQLEQIVETLEKQENMTRTYGTSEKFDSDSLAQKSTQKQNTQVPGGTEEF